MPNLTWFTGKSRCLLVKSPCLPWRWLHRSPRWVEGPVPTACPQELRYSLPVPNVAMHVYSYIYTYAYMCVWHCGTYTYISMYYIYIYMCVTNKHSKNREEKYMMTTCVGLYVYIFVGVTMHTYVQINLSYDFLSLLITYHHQFNMTKDKTRWSWWTINK